MRILILSSRCTAKQWEGLSAIRRRFEANGDTCETLDWLSFLSDAVSQISANNRKIVRKRIQELIGGNTFPVDRSGEGNHESEELQSIAAASAKELARFVKEGEYALVLCAEPVAAFLLKKASSEENFSALTAMVGAENSSLLQSTLDYSISLDEISGDESLGEICSKLNRLVREKQRPSGKLTAPIVQSSLRHHILTMPEAVYEASGIVVNGRRLKSFVFSTDLAIIRNCDADAVFAVYPFTPQQAISEAIIKAAYVPVFCGVGGGTTKGVRTIGLAKDAEAQGAMGVVLNAPISNPNLRAVANAVDIPVVITVVNEDTDISKRLEHGAAIINVAGAAETPAIVRKIREQYPDLPIIASGGNTNDSIRETIRAGANAVTYTPPSTKELFRISMSKYRES